MATFKRGQMVGVPCEIQPGAFPEENLITITTDAGVVSGFVKSAYIEKTHGTSGYVKGTVLEVTSDKVQVRIPGSFFTTASGVTSVSSDWAREHLQAA
ncbi:MAG: hypothetical protein AB7P69_25730 [Candidatus Binatia bacterium]